MFLTLLREQSIAFPSALPFNHHPVGKTRSYPPTEGRIISRFRRHLRGFLPSHAAQWLCSVFNSVLSPQSLTLTLFRLRGEGRKNSKTRLFR